MKRWDIYKAATDATPVPHPVVIISPAAVCENPAIKLVDVALCSTVAASQTLGPTEVGLTEADGLDHFTRCQCHMLYAVAKSRLSGPVGRVSETRREEIRRKLRDLILY